MMPDEPIFPYGPPTEVGEPVQMTEPSYSLVDALKLVPLFYTIGWTTEKKAEWRRITGFDEATTKVLCDHVRSAIEIAELQAAESTTMWMAWSPAGWNPMHFWKFEPSDTEKHAWAKRGWDIRPVMITPAQP